MPNMTACCGSFLSSTSMALHPNRANTFPSAGATVKAREKWKVSYALHHLFEGGRFTIKLNPTQTVVLLCEMPYTCIIYIKWRIEHLNDHKVTIFAYGIYGVSEFFSFFNDVPWSSQNSNPRSVMNKFNYRDLLRAETFSALMGTESQLHHRKYQNCKWVGRMGKHSSETR